MCILLASVCALCSPMYTGGATGAAEVARAVGAEVIPDILGCHDTGCIQALISPTENPQRRHFPRRAARFHPGISTLDQLTERLGCNMILEGSSSSSGANISVGVCL